MIDTESLKELMLRHSWLVEICVFLLLTAAALWLWSGVRRRMAARPEAATTLNGALLQAVGAPVTFVIVIIGLLQSVQVAADHVAFITRFDFSLLRSLAFVVGIFWMLLRITTAAEKIYNRPLSVIGANIDRGTVRAGFRIARYVIIIIAALTAMESVGFSISGLLAFGGISGAVVAFAAQKTLSNFFSGIIIFTERPFSIGDWIRCPGTEVEGVVENIGWRMTQLRTFDQRPLYVPNALFSDNIIENPQRMTNRRIYENMGLRYGDIDKMPAVLKEIRTMLGAHDDIDQAQIQMVNFDRYGDSSLNFFIYAMTRTTQWQEFHRIKEDVLLRTAAIVSKHGADFAFPTRTVHYQPPLSVSVPDNPPRQ